MTNFFADTSALAKRYVVEVGTNWVKSWIQPSAGNVIFVSELTLVEMSSLLARKQREGVLSASDIVQVRNTFLWHIKAEYLVIPVDSVMFIDASNLVSKRPLRTLDAIQLACAIWSRQQFSEPVSFISADRNLLTIAAIEGFSIDDPNAHP